MDRARRLRANRDWREVRRRGRCAADRWAVLCVLPGGDGERFGFGTGRGFRTAVERNRARRRLREAFRQVYRSDGRPRAMTATARRESLDAGFEELKASVRSLLMSLGVPVEDVDRR